LNGLGQVTVRNHALGDDFGAVQLRVPRSDTMEAGNLGLASVLALGTPHDEVEVAVEPLDSLLFRENLNRLDMIKIDVQGYESFVFRGGREIIENLKPALVFEYEDWAWKASGGSFAEVLSMLKAADYVLWPLTTALGEKKIVAYDFLQSVPHIEILALPRDGDRTAGVCAALNLQSSK
jgi:FkbM family methyltransferase